MIFKKKKCRVYYLGVENKDRNRKGLFSRILVVLFNNKFVNAHTQKNIFPFKNQFIRMENHVTCLLQHILTVFYTMPLKFLLVPVYVWCGVVLLIIWQGFYFFMYYDFFFHPLRKFSFHFSRHKVYFFSGKIQYSEWISLFERVCVARVCRKYRNFCYGKCRQVVKVN